MASQRGDFPWGELVERPTRAVALDWHTADIEEPGLDARIKSIGKKGVYAFEGCHDAHPFGTILYVGQSGAGKDLGGQLSTRIPNSLGKIGRWKSGQDRRLHSDVWNVVVRWAEVKDTATITGIEAMLICAHSPPFNAQFARVQLHQDYQHWMVMNAGRKGRLLPVIYGGYLIDNLWEESMAVIPGPGQK